MLVDSFKVAHWMNVRKLTINQVATRAQLSAGDLRSLLDGDRVTVSDQLGTRLSETLSIEPAQIAGAGERELTALWMTAAEVHATRRPIQRDGIHFYNYYSMAGPPGRVAPVILDILCPADRLPKLNNGHLEPAITVNIGPGDIHGRWGEELTDATWQVLAANRSEVDGWIVGDSYVEPSFCAHSYSLASAEPARIISYTATSNLEPLLTQLNDWSDSAFEAMLSEIGEGQPDETLRAELARRGLEPADVARLSGVSSAVIAGLLAGQSDAISLGELHALGMALGLDYRELLPPPRRRDQVGKTCCTIEESRATVRRFRGYTVASIASAPHLPDLTGLFTHIRSPAGELDLCDGGETHYMVMTGEVTLAWRDAIGDVSRKTLTADATAWVGPYVEHGFSGEGAVIRLGSGRHLGYLDRLELTNTFTPGATLRRGRRDTRGWGYDGANDG